VIELARGLSVRTLHALEELETRTLTFDGGRLKLEWPVLRARVGQEVEDVLWWDGDRLVGFLGLYAFGPPSVELAGMVDPGWRRRGVATALIDAALQVCRNRGYEQALLVIPGSSVAGRHLALRREAVLKHSEHALILIGKPLEGPTDSRITLRTAAPIDAPTISALLAAAFGEPAPDVLAWLTSSSQQTLLVDFEDRTVGTVRLSHHGDTGEVYGFAVDPAWQGRGIGRNVLRRVCCQLRQEGAQRIHPEVAVDNDRAVGLYTSIGFTEVSTEHYYALPLT
jgi:ribosomal protein S18 acetylase RimI-like enzyme